MLLDRDGVRGVARYRGPGPVGVHRLHDADVPRSEQDEVARCGCETGRPVRLRIRLCVLVASGSARGRSSLAPCAFLTASAALVRSPMRRRSNCAIVAIAFAIISPAGVVVSTPGRALPGTSPSFGALHDRPEVDQAPTEPVELGYDERLCQRLPALQHADRTLDAWPFEILGRVASILDDLDKLPTTLDARWVMATRWASSPSLEWACSFA
jgi:hypothetical protein